MLDLNLSNKENCPPVLSGVKANWKEDLNPVMNTTSSSLRSPRRLLWPPSERSLAEVSGASMPNLVDLKLPPIIAAKKKRELEVLGNGDQNPFVVTPKPTGSLFGQPPSPVITYPSQPRSEWHITAPFDELMVTMNRLRRLFEKCLCSGVRLELVNLEEPGPNQEKKLIASVLGLNFGTATKVKKLLLLMRYQSINFSLEVVSIFPIYCGGSTGILSEWRSKGPQECFVLKEYGSRATWTRSFGTQTWTR